mgnify:CR=1 FL=1
MRSRRAGVVALAPPLTVALLAGPVLAGLAGTILPAFGWLPGLGGAWGLDGFAGLAATPGILRSALLSLWTGLAATALSLAAVILMVAALEGTRLFALVVRLLSPLLSVPHAAAAFGLAFLIAPSGWIARALSPWATGWTAPPDALVVGDPAGLALIAGLVLKEVPFLLLMTLAALPQAHSQPTRQLTAALGYGPVTGWLKAVLPRVYPQIRLPVFAVLAYGISAVETAIILGPTTPAPLAVRLTVWMRDPALSQWITAAAGAVLLLAVLALALGLWRTGEIAAARLGRRWAEGGGRGRSDGLLRLAAGLVAALTSLPMLAGLAGLAIWSAARLWPFPDALPSGLSGATWRAAWPGLAQAASATALIGLASVALALALVLGCLEAERRGAGRPPQAAIWLLYLPLLVPQIAFLFGLQMLAVGAGLDGRLTGVVLAHLVFVLPYVYLSLAEPWRALDPRFDAVAASLGASEPRIFWRVRLPLLLAPVLTAAAVGFAVSAGLYLPTLLVGAGRVTTLTTEAVAQAAGGDRRLIGVWALSQALMPFAGFTLALGLPALLARWRGRLGGAP